MFGEFVIIKKRRGKGRRDWGLLGDWNNAQISQLQFGGGHEDLQALEGFGNMGRKHRNIRGGGKQVITIGGDGGKHQYQGRWQTITIGGNGQVTQQWGGSPFGGHGKPFNPHFRKHNEIFININNNDLHNMHDIYGEGQEYEQDPYAEEYGQGEQGQGEQGQGEQNYNQEYGEGQQQQQNFGNNYDGNEWLKYQQQNNNQDVIEKEKLDVIKFLDQQITLVEPGVAKEKLEELRKSGQPFIDERFPPNANSLSGQWGRVSQWKDIKWAKLSKKLPNGAMFVGKPQPQDIRQGYLGDCYFLAGLAALSQRPDRIYNLFLLKDVNELNYYSVKMLYKGKWMTIEMDQYIPFMYNEPAFTKSVDKEFWVVMLQKAWAKMYTSYKRTEAGYPQEPLHDLTGAPIKKIFMRRGNNDMEKQWAYLLKASQLEYSMVCSSNPGSDADTSQSGVVLGHAYTFLNAVNLKHQGQLVKLVQLRNPWGKGQYKGKWSDRDPVWKTVDESQKKRIGFKIDDQDEVFWRQFSDICIAQINDDASYIYKSFKDRNKQGVYFSIQIKKQGFYSLQIDKTPQRSFEDKRQSSYRYPCAYVDIGLINAGKMQKLQGFQSAQRTTQQKYGMKVGTYIVKVRIDFDPNFEKDFDVNLAIYSEFPCIIKLATKQEACLLAGKPVNWTGEEAPKKTNSSWNPLGAYGFSEEQGWGKTNSKQNQDYGGIQEDEQQNGNNYYGQEQGGRKYIREEDSYGPYGQGQEGEMGQYEQQDFNKNRKPRVTRQQFVTEQIRVDEFGRRKKVIIRRVVKRIKK